MIGLCRQSCVRPSINFFFKRHLLLNHWSKFLISSQNVPLDALFQNCINGSAPLNRRAARAQDMKSFKQHLLLNHRPKFEINLQNFPHNALYHWGEVNRSNIIKFWWPCQFQRFSYQTLCVFSPIKDRKHIEQNFYSVAGVMPQGWDLGCWGSKTLAWGFAIAPHGLSILVEFIKLVAKMWSCLAFYRFSSTYLINSLIHEHSCKIVYVFSD